MKVSLEITFIKGEHRYIFRYWAGQEEEIMAEIYRAAHDIRLNFDPLDQSRVCEQVEKLRSQLIALGQWSL